ncbi:MAG: TolC family protein [Pseudomonadota bacterium]
MRLCSFTIALLLIASMSQAMDLAGMQTMALNNREVIQQHMTTHEQSEKEIVRAKGAYHPSVDVSYTVNALNEDTLLEQKENAVALGKVSVNLFAGFRDKFGIKSAEMLEQIEQYKLQGIRQDLQLNVALAYLAVFERSANLDVAKSAFQTLGKIYKDGESRFQVGLIGKNELLKFRVDYDNADITFKTAEAGLKKSIIDLSRQVGSEVKFQDLDFADFNNLPPLVDRSSYVEKMLAERNEIKALEAAIVSTSAQTEVARSSYYPRVDAAGSYTRYDDNFVTGNGSYDTEQWRAQLVMSMNLYQGKTTEATVAKTMLQARAQQYELQELKHSLVNDLDNLCVDLQVSLDNIPVAKRSIEQAEENLRITELKYDEGLQRESDLLDAITSLSRAQYNHVAVVRTVFTNHFRLIRMIGGF